VLTVTYSGNYQNALNPTPAVAFIYDPDFPRLKMMQDGTGTTPLRQSDANRGVGAHHPLCRDALCQ
jgi:hypothetical protein